MLFPLLLAAATIALPAERAIRVNQLGYRPDAPKTAVLCATDGVAAATYATFVVEREDGGAVLGPLAAEPAGAFGPCAATFRLDFSALREAGRYRLVAGAGDDRLVSPLVRVNAAAYHGAADSLLHYMRQQRSGWNPHFRDSVHTQDGIVVDDSLRAGRRVPVSGGWADASDYLQYVTTSANATYVMMMAWRDHPRAFDDRYAANGTPGTNGVPDVLDEARHGLDWLLAMYPEGHGDDGPMFNQLGDDRDHSFLDLITTDSSDYGWGKGGPRPVYPCTGRPQGLFRNVNRSDGFASTAGKYAAAFALGAQLWAERDAVYAARLRERALAAYEVGRRNPGVCQTAPAKSPYFYEEDNWVDDMELGATQLLALTGDQRYLREALAYAAGEPYTPWMGADTANHYQWYPWHNNGHHELWRGARGDDAESRAARERMIAYYRDGLERVVARADNGFRIGIPFIWCSNNLMASFATQAYLYRQMSGDERFREYEAAALDWLFGANPWGVSMIIGLPDDGVYARDPHAVISRQLGVRLTGGLLDGPVYRSIFENLRGIQLHEPDEYAVWNTGFIVFHDDFGDYSTAEPIMDGTAGLSYLLAAMTVK